MPATEVEWMLFARTGEAGGDALLLTKGNLAAIPFAPAGAPGGNTVCSHRRREATLTGAGMQGKDLLLLP